MHALIKVPLKFGLVAGVMSVLLMFVLFNYGRHPALIPPFLDFRIIVLLICVFFAIREYKELYNEGFLHFWEGLTIGILTYVILGLIGALFILVYDAFDNSYVEYYISGAIEGAEKYREQLINGPQPVKMSEEEFNSHLTALESTTAGVLARDFFIKTCLIGFLIPLLYGAVFRKVDR